MKRVLITGANSYVGTNVEKWLMREPDKYYVETLDMKDQNWKEFDFSSFDVVFHVAGIAHVSTKKKMKDLYFKVNRDLAIETAQKARDSGVRQFIFMSSMIVYNSKDRIISEQTKPCPDSFYGTSKLEAEIGINLLQTKSFNVTILRPPIIYGPNSKGNFLRLINISRILFVMPNYTNKRSSLYIDNLCLIIVFVIENRISGVFHPQNKVYYSTSQLIRLVRKLENKGTMLTKVFNPLIIYFKNRLRLLTKLFGDFYYSFHDINIVGFVSFEDSIELIIEEKRVL